MLICASDTITTLLNGYTLNKIQRQKNMLINFAKWSVTEAKVYP